MTWAEYDKKVYAWEAANSRERITLVWFDGPDAPRFWTGNYSECNVEIGKPALRLSTGAVIEI